MKTLTITLLTLASCYSASAAIFTDDFNRADGSLGANWSNSINTDPLINKIQSNQYLYTAASSPFAAAGAFTPATLTNMFSVEGDVRVATPGGAGLAFNIQQITNPGDSFYALQIFNNDTAFQIIKFTNGTIAGLFYDATALSVTTNAADFYHMTLNVTAPGVMSYTVTNIPTATLLYSGSFSDPSAQFSGGNAGFYNGGDIKVADNFYVNTAVPEPSSFALFIVAAIGSFAFVKRRSLKS